MQLPPSHAYRPALAVAFLLVLLWVALLSVGMFERMPLPPGAKIVIALLTPLSATIAILCRTPLFREMRMDRRFINLLGVALALLVCAGVILVAIHFGVFALGMASPGAFQAWERQPTGRAWE